LAKQLEGKKRFWIWVTSKDYYQDEDGSDRADLDPSSDSEDTTDGLWTCHRDTKAGDLILLYRSRPKSDIAYLMEARSGAKIWREYPIGTPTDKQYVKQIGDFFSDTKNSVFAKRVDSIHEEARQAGFEIPQFEEIVESLEEAEAPRIIRKVVKKYLQLIQDVNVALGLDPMQELAGEWEGSWACEYLPRFKLSNPIPRSDLKADPHLIKQWPALRGNFQKRVYEIPESVWGYLVGIISKKNAGFQKTVNRLMPVSASQDIISEIVLENALIENLSILAPNFNVRLFQHSDGTSGRQYPCSWGSGYMGFIDLLCVDRRNGDFLVIELKVVRAGLPAFAQLRSYVGWVKEHLAHGKSVRGLLICEGQDDKFRYAASTSNDISVLELSEVRKKLFGK
jgi:hypothetical protein